MKNLINSLIASINAQTEKEMYSGPVLTMVVLTLPVENDPKGKTQTLYVEGKVVEVKAKVNAWLRGNADLVGVTSRINGQEIVLTHRIGMRSFANVF